MVLDERLDKCIKFSTLQMLLSTEQDPKNDKSITENCPDCSGYNQCCKDYVRYREVYFSDVDERDIA
jgi:hypothetical protein